MEELINKLHTAMQDEDKDVAKYEEMAEECYEYGCEGASQIIHDIAAEEAIHAKHIKCILSEIA